MGKNKVLRSQRTVHVVYQLQRFASMAEMTIGLGKSQLEVYRACNTRSRHCCRSHGKCTGNLVRGHRINDNSGVADYRRKNSKINQSNLYTYVSESCMKTPRSRCLGLWHDILLPPPPARFGNTPARTVFPLRDTRFWETLRGPSLQPDNTTRHLGIGALYYRRC